MFDLRVFAGPGGVKSPDIVRPAPGGEVKRRGGWPGHPISASIRPLPDIRVRLTLFGIGHTLSVPRDEQEVAILCNLELLSGEIIHVSGNVGDPVSKPGSQVFSSKKFKPVLLGGHSSIFNVVVENVIGIYSLFLD